MQLPKLELGSQAAITASLNSYFLELHEDGLSDSAKDFIHNCLVFDSDRRLTARQALDHAWLQEPREDRVAFEELEVQSLTSWSRRDLIFPAIEDLDRLAASRAAAHTQEGNERDKSLAKVGYRKFSVSPYFENSRGATLPLKAKTSKQEVSTQAIAVLPSHPLLASPDSSSLISNKHDNRRPGVTTNTLVSERYQCGEELPGQKRRGARDSEHHSKRRAICPSSEATSLETGLFPPQ